MAISTKCSKCGSSMSQGFIVDQAHGMPQVSQWQEGPPPKSFWLGGVTRSGADRFEITTMRCDRCGYLESYAPKA